jgi:hypothetical protein
MLVEVLHKYVPNVGRRGAVVNVDRNSAHVLITLGMVKKHEKNHENEVVHPKKKQPIRRKKRAYKRRDMRAESANVIVPEIIDETEQEIIDENEPESTE